MNIFALDIDTRKAAQYHVNNHVSKLVLEHCQLLCTAHRVLDGVLTGSPKKYRFADSRDTVLYTATHMNHPSAIWTRQGKDNYLWLCEFTQELCAEYTYRYGKVHKCKDIGLLDYLQNNVPCNIGNKSFTMPTPAMPDEYKQQDVVKAYRAYYLGAKRSMFDWRGKVNEREVPEWVLDSIPEFSYN